MNAVTDWGASIITGVTAGFAVLISSIPFILGALILLVIGWFVAKLIGGLIAKLAHAAKFDHVGDKTGMNDFMQKSGSKLTLSKLLGMVVQWSIFLIFIELAAEQLRLPQVTQIINRAVDFIPNVIVAILIVAAGAWFAQILAGLVKGSLKEAKIGAADVVAQVTHAAVIAFAVIAALNQLQIAPLVIDTLYIGVVAAVSLAFALAFGLGGREAAGKLTQQWAEQAGGAAKKLQATPPKPPAPSSSTPANSVGTPIRTTSR